MSELPFPFYNGGGGPLFLSSPPWMLSQSAMSLLVDCDVVLGKRRVVELRERLGLKIGELGFDGIGFGFGLGCGWEQWRVQGTAQVQRHREIHAGDSP
ncbi:hypothetical protein Drorol1_Dr00017839 [Drosera rotundifolia]